jgi:hypothetical protein
MIETVELISLDGIVYIWICLDKNYFLNVHNYFQNSCVLNQMTSAGRSRFLSVLINT